MGWLKGELFGNSEQLDTISRAAVLDEIHKYMEERDYTIGTLYDNICEMPSAQPGWIPCSERLPKKDGRYQVTRHDDVTNTEFIDILWYEGNLWWNRHSTGDYAVTAWMPLPELWKGKQNE